MKTYPLLQSQIGVLLQSMQHPESTQYNLPIYIFMPLPMTRKGVVAVAQKTIDSFPELHTRFVIGEDGEIRQWSDLSMPIPVVSRKCTEAELQTYIREGFLRPFDPLGSEPLFRAEVVETEKNICLLVDGHHAIIDGMSFKPILTSAFAKIAEGGSIEPQPYGMYQAAEDEVTSFGTEAYQRAKTYYAKKFAGQEMVTLSHAKSGTIGQMGRCIATLNRHECDDWCSEHNVKPSHLFQAAFGHVMSVLTRDEQVAFAVENHGRGDRRLLSCVGMFVKTIPMLVHANPACRVIDFIRSQREEVKDAISHIQYPFTHFCSDLGMKPGVMFNFMAVEGLEEGVQLDGARFRAVQPVRDEVDSDLSISIYIKGYDYEIRVESSLAMNDEATLRLVADSLKETVSKMIAYPDLTLGELDIVSTDERKALITLGRGKQIAIDPQMTFVKAFGRCASQHPDRLAVADAHDSLTYGELSRRSDALAHRLIASGVKPDDFVAVMLDRTIDFPLAVIAIHKAGAAYVPIDQEYPEERQQYMLSDCQAKVVIDRQFMVETDFSQDADPIDLSTADGLAYMIYTSGSTGRPKGVMIGQRGLTSYIASMTDVLALTASDRISLHRPFSFDAHIQDLYPVLTIGGSLHIMPSAIRRDIQAMRDFITRHGITGGSYTTSLGRLLIESGPLPLRYMTLTGERMADMVSGDVQLFNGYGPTECTDLISAYRLQRGRSYANIPIGRPMANSHCFIVDARGRLLPRGAEGELCFAGVQVSIGYWQQPKLTAEKFDDCPFLLSGPDGQPVRMYRTGDLCRWNDEGLLEFLGRTDEQVKLRGYRIEPGEIESCANGFKGISQAVAVVHPIGGTDTLCLYYTADGNTMVDAGELRRFMSRTLAEYMVPTAYMQLDALPLTPNGKVDRRRMPEPRILQEAIVAPATELEQAIFDIVASELETADFGVTTDLVALGLSSLDAMSVSLAISQQTGLKINVNEVLEHPTIRHMAETARCQHTDSDINLADFHYEQDNYPLTANQRGVYIDWEMNRDTTQYNVPVAVCLGQTDANKLADALRQVVDAHSYIKTRLENRDGSIVQLRRDDAPVQISVSAVDNEPDRDFFQQRVRPFNLFSDDLYRLEIYTFGGRTWLFKDFHHIVTDGLSETVFFRDLQAALHGTQPKKETVTAFDYALYEQGTSPAKRGSGFSQGETSIDRYAEARNYFDHLLAGAEVASYPRTASGTAHRVGSVTATVVDSEAIRKACRRMGITPNSYFQTVLAQVLHRLTRQEHLMLATVSNGRSLAQTEDIMGMFVKTLPMVSVDGDSADTTFATAAQAIHRQSIESMSHDSYPLTEMVERHGLHPEILYAFEGDIYDHIAAFSTDTDVITLILDTPKMPIEVTVYPDRQGVYTILLNYDAALYSQASMMALASALTTCAISAANEGILLSDIELTTDEQRNALVELGTGKQIDIDPQMTFVKAFEQCASLHPDRLAVADAHDSLTYGELSRRSDALAHRLIASGIRPNDFVAVMLDRTIDFPLAVIAIHKAGAAYVPIDLEYPEERQQYMLSDCQAKVIIDRQYIAETDFNGQWSMFNGPLDQRSLATEETQECSIDLSSADGLAYMIYTSGSTGNPKGAMIHQAALWNFIQAYTEVTALSAADRISGHNSFSFDGHVEDMFPILTLGGSYHIMSADIRLNLAAIREFLFEHQITGGGFTTALTTLLFAEYDDLPVRFLTAGGEKLGRIFSNHVEIINTYGPTECTVETTYYPILPGRRVDNIPIGKTFANCYSFIVDAYGRLLPRGAVGELYTAGKQVGRGYWHQPELTAEKFTLCPFLPSTPMMYRTGDLCRWNADGDLEYMGRSDDQVKLRGFRIELGEIESCASKFEGISQAVAVIRPIKGTNTLCLYYTADGDSTVDVDELRQFLSHTLAEYMLPTTYKQMEALPLTENGKVDRRHLPEPTLRHRGYVAPRNELEKLIVSGFEKVLNQEKISVNDDFVHLGGDSLDALKLVFSLGKSGITVADVLSLRTPAAIASNAKRISVNLNNYSIESGCPLNNSQMFIYQDIVKFDKYDSYLIPSLIPIDSKYTDEQIRNALDVMFTAHPVLTMHVAIRDGVPYMEKGDKPAVMKGSLNPLKLIKLLTTGFDLYSHLSRHVIIRIPGRCYLLSIIHHLIFDKVSNNVFCRHFQRALEGDPLDFIDDHFLKISSFHQEVKSTEQYAEMNKYISSMLSNLSETNFYRNPDKPGKPGYHERELGVDREQVNRFTERFGITKNIMFTAAMAITLSKLVGNNDVAFGFLDNGRDRFDNYEDLGLYITGMPLVAHVDHHDMQVFLDNLSDVYYKLSQNNYFPFATLVQEFNIAPIILFQFFPDWITENGENDHLPENETLNNTILSTQKDFMVEALVDVNEMKDNYILKITYSGYYSRKMMKALAATYKETIIKMLKVEV